MSNENSRYEAAKRLIRNEVGHNVSALVSTLSGREWDGSDGVDQDDLYALAVAEPNADDYREAAAYDDEGKGITVWQEPASDTEDSPYWCWTYYPAGSSLPDSMERGEEDDEVAAWRAAFEAAGMDAPDGREVYEHWLVSDWLADKLEAKGETVRKDVAGLTIWGRTTSGQAIALDHVVQVIAHETYGDPDPRQVASEERARIIGQLAADDVQVIVDALDILSPDSADGHARREALSRRFQHAAAVVEA